nr:peptidyl-prolyl cis-trans isomerase CYP71 [Tanacetum cinerariifolium]
MSAMANTTPLVTTVTKPATNPRDADAAPRVNIQKEPDKPKDAPTGRDVFNENPSHDELMAVSDIAKPLTTSLARRCVDADYGSLTGESDVVFTHCLQS